VTYTGILKGEQNQAEGKGLSGWNKSEVTENLAKFEGSIGVSLIKDKD